MAHRRNHDRNTKSWIKLGRLLFVCITFLFVSGTALSQDWPLGTFYYEITRSNNQIGIHKIVSKRQGEDAVVETEEWVDDTGYCRASKRREIWRRGTLTAFDSLTAGWCSIFVRMARPSACPWDEFGDPITVSVVRKEKVLFKTVGSEKSQQISAEAVPMNFLNPAFRGSDHIVQVISPITGELKSMIVSNKGVEHLSIGNTSEKTERYLVQDQDGHNRELWYDMRGVWIQMFLHGDTVTFAAASPAQMESEVASFVRRSDCLRTLPNHTN
ncbi:MAG: DUF6134 family protein [Candidatus Methylomirabilales bacterium]